MVSKRKFLLPYVIVLLLLMTGCIGETVESEMVAEVEAETNTDSVEEHTYDYDDFVGYYLHFDSNERAHSDMIVTLGDEYLTIGWYMSEFEQYEILDWSINDNVLTIDYYLQPYSEGAGENGSLSIYLSEEKGEKTIDFRTDMPFYAADYDEVLSYNYSIKDYLVADINK